jgi:hypothetical protein
MVGMIVGRLVPRALCEGFWSRRSGLRSVDVGCTILLRGTKRTLHVRVHCLSFRSEVPSARLYDRNYFLVQA